jgi:NAD(P)-dependent dehydrogenase (short-subunit alcohol dehydrogenase family)
VNNFNSKFKALHILINNAGTWPYLPKNTSDGLQEIFQVNHLSHFLLVNLLLPKLRNSGKPDDPARVVTVSSGLHYKGDLLWSEIDAGRVVPDSPYDPFKAYANSKLINVIFATELQRFSTLQPTDFPSLLTPFLTI